MDLVHTRNMNFTDKVTTDEYLMESEAYELFEEVLI